MNELTSRLLGAGIALAEEAAGAAAAGEEIPAGNAALAMIIQLLPMILIFVVFYFMLIRPQRKKYKEAKAMLDALKVGDHITTIGGINATIVNIKDQTLTVEVGAPGEAQKSKMTIERWAVRNVNQLTIENDAETLI